MRYADPEDLRILTDYITMNRKGNPRFNEGLTTTPEYARYYPDGLNNMVDSIVEEFQYYGGNTVLNFMRGRGAGYREILCDVCHRMRVNFNRKSSVEVIEMNLLHSILIKSLEDMDTESLKELLDSLNIKTTKFDKQAMVAAVQIAIRKGGFAAYKIAVIVANAIAFPGGQCGAGQMAQHFRRTCRLGNHCRLDCIGSCRSCLPCHYSGSDSDCVYEGKARCQRTFDGRF